MGHHPVQHQTRNRNYIFSSLSYPNMILCIELRQCLFKIVLNNTVVLECLQIVVTKNFMNVAFTHLHFLRLLKINSNGKKCSVFYSFTVLCNFLECDTNVKPVYGNYHKVFWKTLHEMEIPLKRFQLVQNLALYCN